MPSNDAASPPLDGDGSHTRRGVLATAAATLAAGCTGFGLQSSNRNEPDDGPGFATGEERVIDPPELAVEGRDRLMTKRDIHLANNHEEEHVLAVRIERDGSEEFATEYTLAEKDEVELDGVFASHGEWTVTVAMDGETTRTVDVVVDARHLGVRGFVFEDGSLNVQQVPCDSNSCP